MRAVIVALGLLVASPAATQAEETPGWRYLFDGGALPFFWGSTATAIGTTVLLSPPKTPFLFSDDEGGAESGGDAIPNYQVAVLSVAMMTAAAIPSRPARFFHLKGFAESVMTTTALTEVAKNIFGRQRPSFDDTMDIEDTRKSFFSGHASVTWSSSTYLALYLNRHVFSEWRAADSEIAWWEPAPYAALVALSIYVPYTRVRDKRHHLSDVITGGTVGTVASIGFFIYQERRFRRMGRSSAELSNVALVPSRRGLSLIGSW